MSHRPPHPKSQQRQRQQQQREGSSDGSSPVDRCEEDGFVLIDEEQMSAEWDGDQTKYAPPTRYHSALQTAHSSAQSARSTWENLSWSGLRTSVSTAASSIVEKGVQFVGPQTRTVAGGVSARVDERRERREGGRGPERNVFADEEGEEEKKKKKKEGRIPEGTRKDGAYGISRGGRRKEDAGGEGGLRIECEEEGYDPLGVSERWEGRKRTERQEEERKRLLEVWKGKEERTTRGGRERGQRGAGLRDRDQGLGSGPSGLGLKKKGSNEDQRRKDPGPATREQRCGLGNDPHEQMLDDLESSRAFTPTLANRARFAAEEAEETRRVMEEEYQNALGSGSQSRAQRNVRPMESASTFRRSAAGELSYGTSKLDWNYGLEVRHC